ncbi:spt7 [Nucleospora cyclopteri]
MNNSNVGINFIYEFISYEPKKKALVDRQINLQKQMSKILISLRKEPKAAVFLNKVSKKEVPNYYDIIKNPMDLGTMGQKLHLYRTLEEFKADLDLIWSNCLYYNANAPYYIDCANSMKEAAKNLFINKQKVFPYALEANKQSPVLLRNNVRSEIGHFISQQLKQVGFEGISNKSLNILIDAYISEISKGIKTRCKTN